VIAIISALICSKDVLSLMFGMEYGDYSLCFNLLVAGMAVGFFNWILNSALTAAELYQHAFRLEFLAFVVTVLLSWTLIPPLGLIGAAVVGLCVQTISTVVKYVVLRVAVSRRLLQPVCNPPLPVSYLRPTTLGEQTRLSTLRRRTPWPR
jgi:O-antigen/teichoic acid export membrane protein